MVFAYFGPETFVPVSSMIAAVVGVGMILGRNTLIFVFKPLKAFGRLLRRKGRAQPTDVKSAGHRGQAPHFRSLENRRQTARAGGEGRSPGAASRSAPAD
jgi:hypothetical protein